MKRLFAFVLSALCLMSLAACGRNKDTVFKNEIPNRIAFTFAFDEYGYESDEIYFCQIIGNDLFVYEDFGENIYGRFFEYKNGEYNFYYRNYTGDNVWLRDTELEKAFKVSDIEAALNVYVGPGYALNVEILQGMNLKGEGYVVDAVCDLYGYDDESYYYDADTNMILKYVDPDMDFYYEVFDRSYGVIEFLDSPMDPSSSVDFRAVFGK